MCGVAGIFSYHYAASPIDRLELRVIRDAMERRGPDGFGEWVSGDGRVGLGHRRLAIIDLKKRANQPMVSHDGKCVISYNGEIYNYRELRDALEKKGRRFFTESDTEVLLQMYDEHGVDMLTKLRGMFAFALWDSELKKILLVRDPYGIKPLYYADDGWTLRFASQVKALLMSNKVSRIKEPAGIVGFFLTGSVPEPFTFYQEIRQVPAGSYVWIDSTGPKSAEHYESIGGVYERIFTETHSLKNAGSHQSEEILSALADSIKYHFTSDVPVGIFLSAGVDSNAIASLSAQLNIDTTTAITLSFDEFTGTSFDETPIARKTAQRLGFKYMAYCLTQSEFKKELPLFFNSMDQPSIDGLNTYFVSKAAKICGLKTAVSGVGGDELFGGYPSFDRVQKMVRNLGVISKMPGVGRLWRCMYQALLGNTASIHPKFSGLLRYGGTVEGAYFLARGLFMPWELEGVIDGELAHHGLDKLGLLRGIKESSHEKFKNKGVRISILEASLYLRNQLLRDADWGGMAHSLEIRTPFVDIFLLKNIAPYLVRNKLWRKELLIEAMKTRLPDSVVNRRKTGFTLPMRKWIEKIETDQSWQSVDALSEPGCPWSRRWAYLVYQRSVV